MNFNKVGVAYFLAFLLLGNVQAAGNPVGEVFSTRLSL
jgi:hypothetical protein